MKIHIHKSNHQYALWDDEAQRYTTKGLFDADFVEAYLKEFGVRSHPSLLRMLAVTDTFGCSAIPSCDVIAEIGVVI